MVLNKFWRRKEEKRRRRGRIISQMSSFLLLLFVLGRFLKKKGIKGWQQQFAGAPSTLASQLFTTTQLI